MGYYEHNKNGEYDIMETITREKAFELLKKYNKDPFHIQHGLTVEAVMRSVSYTHLDVYKRQHLLLYKKKCGKRL